MRRATIRTTHGTETDARRLAAAVRPDNTDQMETRVRGPEIVTTIERETTGGLQSTIDDYAVNLRVAQRCSDGSTDDETDTAISTKHHSNTNVNHE